MLDPGLGFAKRGEHNWELLAHLDAVAALGRPLLVGASRKSFLGTLLAGPDGTPRPPAEREHAHAALVPLLADLGVWGLRVHDVRATTDALAAWQAWRSRRSAGPGATTGQEQHAMTDELTITGVECFAHHGVFDFERREGQTFVIDLALGIDTRAGGRLRRLAGDRRLRDSRGPGPGGSRVRPRGPDRDRGPTHRRRVPDRASC